jgi:flagellar basal-body rod protein FlgF
MLQIAEWERDMSQGIYTALSGAVGRQRWLDQVSHDLAHATTPGYHGRRLSFEEVYVSEESRLLRAAEVQADMRPGPREATGRPLDVVIDGPGFFVVESGQGDDGYLLTRDGRLQVDREGTLRMVDGRAVMGEGGSRVSGAAGALRVEVDETGRVLADGRTIGRLALVEAATGGRLDPYGGVHFRAEAVVAVPEADRSVRSGYVEGSNVEPVRSMVEMISLHRTFDAVYAMIREHHGLDQRVIRSVGAST